MCNIWATGTEEEVSEREAKYFPLYTYTVPWKNLYVNEFIMGHFTYCR